MTSRKRTVKEYLVLWAGYNAEWEELYRQGRGQVGDQFSSWEPERSLKHTDALAAWKTNH